MNNVPSQKEECCGCAACVNTCPKHAIEMKMDFEGFLYPSVDESQCVSCGLCLNNCSFLKRQPVHNLIPKSFIVRHNNEKTRMNSRSGAVFVSCSDFILKKKGVVYGCVMNGNKAIHVRAESKKDRDEMCRSKYVQSDTQKIYSQIQEDLITGKYVLFSGTGCQVDAVVQYLKRKHVDMSNFYSMDLVCHGAPSPRLFSEYFEYMENLYKGKIEHFEFRDKSVCGWDDHIETFEINGVKHFSTKWRELFYTNAISRPSCSNCKYAALNRAGDITFADAWGIKQAAPEIHDNRGVSSILVNSKKGEDLLTYVQNECYVKEVPLNVIMQHNMKKTSMPTVNREKLWKVYSENGIAGLIECYGRQSVFIRLKQKIKYILRKIYYGKKMFLPGYYPFNH